MYISFLFAERIRYSANGQNVKKKREISAHKRESAYLKA